MQRPLRTNVFQLSWRTGLLAVLAVAAVDCQTTTGSSGPDASSASLTPHPPPLCFVDSPHARCRDNYWPASEVPNLIPYASNTPQLTISDVTLLGPPDRVMPIPPPPATLVTLVALAFYRIANTDPQAEFPFQRMVSLLNKTSVMRLRLDDVGRITIGADYFAGFSGLRKLKLEENSLVGLHPDSFLPFSGPAPAGLRKLTIEDDRHLAEFPWDVLRPVASSIESIELVENRLLSEIVASSSSVPFPRLRRLKVSHSKVRTLPDSVVMAYSLCTSAHLMGLDGEESECRLSFHSNRHNCSDCTTFKPLRAWANGGPGRSTRVSCEEPDSKVTQVDGDAHQWRRNELSRLCDD